MRYRGYRIEDLADSSSFLECAFLLIYGELPTKPQFVAFENEVMRHTIVHRDIEAVVGSFRYDSHPMAMLASSLAALGAYAPEANPSLQGQAIYSRAASGESSALKLMDKQIYRST